MGKKRKKKTKRKRDPAELKALALRLAMLESRLAEVDVPAAPRASSDVPVERGGEERPWPLDGLHQRMQAPGGIVFAGLVDLPDDESVARRASVGTAALLDRHWSAAADQLAALAHPVRLELIRQVLRGAHSTAELTALDIVGTTGQLYHHLRHLIAAGWLQQTGRGRYQVPAARAVPLLVVVAACGGEDGSATGAAADVR